MISRNKYWSVVIYPKTTEDIDWKSMDKESLTTKLEELLMITPSALGKVLVDLRLEGDKKKNSDEYYLSTVKRFTGQLELGTKNGRPHYQLAIELTSRVTLKKLKVYFSKAIYGEMASNAISIEALKNNFDEYSVGYCLKEDRANLLRDYTHVSITQDYMKSIIHMEENSELKKYWKARFGIKTGQ